MSKTIMIGCDLHDRSMLVRFSVGEAPPQQKSFGNTRTGREQLIHFFKQLAKKHRAPRTVFVYEASGLGYGLADQLEEAGLECHVLSPALLPKTVRSKKLKTDAKDAQMLLEQVRAFVLAGNPLPVVWRPPQRLRDDRELIRCRLDSADEVTAIKLKILSMLKRRGVERPERFRNGYWSRAWVAWLKETAETLDSFVAPVLLSLVARFETYRDELARLDRAIARLADTPRYKAPCEELCLMRGVGLLTAMTFLTEMGDLSRFENRRQIGAYLGLCPCSFESGESNDRKGHITRQGPSRLRRVLCQATWSALRHDPKTARDFRRLHRGRQDRRKKAVVALMRQLGIRMWHRALDCGVSDDLVGHGPGGRRTSAEVHSAPTWGHTASARAQQRGAAPSASPSHPPLAGTG